MALHLIDTNVVSEAARPRPDPGVVAFLQRERDICVSVILFEELSFGLERAPPERRAASLPPSSAGSPPATMR